ncbi:hypothetical protein K501DRAFT_332095 [Backusella circina FSU 941]|nr:hypothetical protein K501DRAFT_332095 [Backusella circina FSU 941]
MRPLCTPTTLLLYILFIHIVTAALHRKRDEGDDTSLFDMDGNEEDTYRMIERMQDLSPEDQVEDDEIKEIERMDRQIQDEQLHIQQHESDNDNIPDEDEVKQHEEEDQDNSENNDDDEQEDEEEEEDDDDENIDDGEDDDDENNDEEIGPFDFKNDDEAEYFENLPISSPQTPEEDDSLKSIEEEEHTNDDEEEDEELEELDEEEALVQPTMAIPQASKVEAPIPWQRPNSYGKIDTSSFYQDENAIRVVEKSRFKVWHGITVLVILGLAYRSLPRKKSNGLDLTWNKDEKDYLPLHNKGKYYKSEIKNC